MASRIRIYFGGLTLLFGSASGSAQAETELQPKRIELEELSPAYFDRAWSLPLRRTDGGRDLALEMETLSRVRVEYQEQDGVVVRTVGDLVSETRRLSRKEREEWFAELEQRAPSFCQDWGAALRQLVMDDRLKSKRWKPAQDHDRDGILTTAGSWNLANEAAPIWKGLEVTPNIEQAAILMQAPLQTIKAAESDYRRYYGDPGTAYKRIYPVANSYVRGSAEDGCEFASLRVFVRSDLPFPFSYYDCDVRQLHYVVDGKPMTDVYSLSEDFHWLAGRDVYVPLRTSDDQIAGWIVVRLYGFDLDGIPDKPKHRREALRGSMGNLKRRAEARPARDAKPWNPEQGIPSFRVLGKR